MKLLILHWGAYIQNDILETLKLHNIHFKIINYCFGDKNKDPFFTSRFTGYLQEAPYDGVLTVNYFPLIAEVCYQLKIKYLSWSYDNPLNVKHLEETLGYETNYVFLFDKKQVQTYSRQGYPHIYHLPLAVNPRRLQRIHLSAEDKRRFSAPISFVGKLYPSSYLQLRGPLNEYTKGYLDSIIESQLQVYGYYFIDDLLSDSFLSDINRQYAASPTADHFTITKEQLSYAMATYVTRKERLLLLSMLSRRFTLKLYSREQPSLLSKAEYMGSVGYLKDMLKVFQCSKINLNITLKILQTGIPLRVMDILGSGGFLLSNYQEELLEYFVPDQDIAVYENLEDAVNKAAFYLSHDDIREKISINGQQKAIKHFTYEKQLEKLFQTAGLL